MATNNCLFVPFRAGALIEL